MDIWPKDWGYNWARKGVGTRLRFVMSVAVILAYLLFVHLTHYPWVHEGVNLPALLLGAILIISLFAMRGFYKKAHRSDSSNS